MAAVPAPGGPGQPTIAGAYHSRPVGDVVLANPPPYRMLPWLGMGIPLVSALLEQHGISSRIVRFLDDPNATPRDICEASEEVMWGNPPLDERLTRIRALAETHNDFFDLLVSRLLAGPERVFGFSTWRLNADVVIELARRVKLRRPDAFIVIGGPEATAFPADFHREWIDVVVVNGSEGALGPVFRALLDGRIADAAIWEKVWINPRHGATRPANAKLVGMPPMPRIDYAPIVPLFLSDPEPVIPALLNVGCPFHCSFCTNSTIYPGLEWGSVERLVDEMMQISTVWKRAFGNAEVPKFRITLCDATINAQPEQFDQLCELMAQEEWPHRPQFDAYIVLSGRITAERVRLAVAAGFDSFFFGLETASRRLRSVVKKPGTIESVAQALQILREVGKGALRVTCGVIVGWPGETEEEFYETVAFLDWAAALNVFEEFSVNPLMRVPSAEDLGELENAEGGPYGLHWRLPGPAGTPDVRARRALHLIEHFSGIMRVNLGLPMRLVEEMIDNPVEPFWKRWQAVHEEHLSAGPTPPEQIGHALERSAVSTHASVSDATGGEKKAPRFVADVQRALGAIVADAAGDYWKAEAASEWLADREAALFRFVSNDGVRTVAVLLEVRDDEKRAYARTARFNVSYLSEPGFTSDDALIRSVTTAIAAAEEGPMTSAALAQFVPAGLAASSGTASP